MHANWTRQQTKNTYVEYVVHNTDNCSITFRSLAVYIYFNRQNL